MNNLFEEYVSQSIAGSMGSSHDDYDCHTDYGEHCDDDYGDIYIDVDVDDPNAEW